MPIIISGTIDFDPPVVERALRETIPLVVGARAQDGCMDYDWCPDPVKPGRVRVYERWRDEESLKRHFANRWYNEMRAALGSYGLRGADISKFRCDITEPVYDTTGTPRADFFTAPK